MTLHASRPPQAGAGFTLIEVMIVLGIIAIMAAVGVPAFYRAFRKEALRQAVSDIVEVCSNARARAILSGGEMDVIFRPQDRHVSIGGVASPAGGGNSGDTLLPQDTPLEPKIAKPGSGVAATWSDRLSLEMLDVNFIEYKDLDEARVRFFPDGTSDELTVILKSDKNEYRKISVEVTTGLASVEVIR